MFAAARTSVLRSARTQLRHTQSQTATAWSRLASTLAVLEAKEGKLNIASLAAITAGTKLGGSITAFVAGSGGKTIAEEAGKAKGIEKVIYVDNAAYDKVRPMDRRDEMRCRN
jgi:electron transfer flavoprotein alpha subunit